MGLLLGFHDDVCGYEREVLEWEPGGVVEELESCRGGGHGCIKGCGWVGYNRFDEWSLGTI